MYDVTERDSFDKISSWMRQVSDFLDLEKVAVALVGNKVDIDEDEHAISAEQAQAYANQNGLKFFLTSAKTGKNVNELFHYMAEVIHRKQSRGRISTLGQEDELGRVYSLTLESPLEKKKKNCQC